MFKTPYSQAFRAANPAQRAALEGLSTKLKLRGNDRLGVAYKKYGKLDSEDMEPSAVLGYRFVTLSRSVVLTQSLRQKGDSQTRSRLETLISDESANPLRS
ncbi:hypothetical protein EON81_28535 [bacterium]|nr:MAG: hypothetical protein EON81_28535 [bacterium]